MREQRGLTDKTVAAYCHYAAGLLDEMTATDGSVEWDRLGASIVNAYVAEHGRPYGVVARAHIVGSVRCLLRWALSTGRLDRDLTGGILKPAGTRRSVPRGVDAEQVEALLAVCDPATAIGESGTNWGRLRGERHRVEVHRGWGRTASPQRCLSVRFPPFTLADCHQRPAANGVPSNREGFLIADS